MKKIILTVVAFAAVSFAAVADNEVKPEVNVDNAQYAINFNNERIASHLKLTAEQKADMNEIHAMFSRDMHRASSSNLNKRTKLTKRAIIRDLAYMRSVLDPEQYYMYRTLLNATIQNRGIQF